MKTEQKHALSVRLKHANPQFQDLSPDSENTLRASADIPSSELAYKDVF